MNFYIPKEIPKNFLSNNGFQPLEKVSVRSIPDGVKMHCLNNVNSFLARNEGEIRFGWMFSMLGKFVLKLHAHAVIELPNKTLLCVTPPEKPIKLINFSRDQSISSLIQNNRLPTKSYSLVNDPDVHELVRLENSLDFARMSGEHERISEVALSKALLAVRVKAYFQSHTKPSDICYCGSAKKNRYCCGKSY